MPANCGLLQIGARLQAPNSDNLRAKSPIVSGGFLKYSRFRETATGDWVRSRLRGRACRVIRQILRLGCRQIGVQSPLPRRLRAHSAERLRPGASEYLSEKITQPS